MKYLSILLFLTTGSLSAQIVSEDSLIRQAWKRHPSVRAAEMNTSSSRALNSVSNEIPKTEVMVMRGQYNSFYNNDQNITVSQTVPFPGVLVRRAKLNKARVEGAVASERVSKNNVAYEIRSAYNELLFHKARRIMLLRQDSLMDKMVRIAALQYSVGETAMVSKTSMETQGMELKNELTRNLADIEKVKKDLMYACVCNFDDISGQLSQRVLQQIDSANIRNPLVLERKINAEVVGHQRRVEVAKALPDITVGYFNQSLVGFHNVNGSEQFFGRGERFDGFQIGLSIPLLFPAYTSNLRSLSHNREAALQNYKEAELQLSQELSREYAELKKNQRSLEYYTSAALVNASQLKRHAAISFEKGDTDYRTFILNFQQALTIEQNYIQTLYEYNQNIITINFLYGNDL